MIQSTVSSVTSARVRSSGLQAWLRIAPQQSEGPRRTDAPLIKHLYEVRTHARIHLLTFNNDIPPGSATTSTFSQDFFFQNSSATMAVKEIKSAGLIAYVGHLRIERLIE